MFDEESKMRDAREKNQEDCKHIFKPMTKDIFTNYERVTRVYCEKCLKIKAL